MTEWNVASAAQHLLDAEAEQRDITPITDEWAALDVETAYRVQDEVIRLKQAEGHTVTGVKLGLTSRAKQQRMGISSPLTAVITDGMVLGAGVPVPLDELIHPRIEPEIVFVMGRELKGPGVTAAAAMAAVETVHAGFEVIDSRFKDFKFTLPDVIADNASSARYIVSARGFDPQGLDLALEAVLVRVNGSVVDTATGAAVQGHPGEALALAANSLAERGLSIPPGALVLTGGLTDAVFVNPGDQISAEFTTLGTIVTAGSAA
jgi:2-oxo-3-hexenedioate decarboxylase